MSALERARQAWETNERRVDVQLRIGPGMADRDLDDSLDRIIAALDRAARAGIPLDPKSTHALIHALEVTKDCHRTMTIAERDLANVTALDPYSRKV
jgi:hypothetical protein